MAEHHDLDVLVRLRASGRHDEAEDPTQPDVEEREGHGGSSPSVKEKCQSRGPIGILAPFSLALEHGPVLALEGEDLGVSGVGIGPAGIVADGGGQLGMALMVGSVTPPAQ